MEELQVQVQEVNKNKEKNKKKMDYRIEGNVAVFTTSQGIEFFVDEEDAERVSQYRWCVKNDGYVQGWVTGKHVLLHRFILGVESKTFIIDHINHNKRNNCKCNLRICTNQENQRNRKDVKGIYKNSNGTYQAYIVVDMEKIHLGTYESEQMARAVRLIAEKEFFGNYSPNVHLFNDPETQRLYNEAMASIDKYRYQNKACIDGDLVYVTVSYKDVTEEFILSIEDYELIKNYKWCMNDKGYIHANIDGEQQLLTRFILGLPRCDKTKRVKFKDGDKFNFRRENLEVIEGKTKKEESIESKMI